MEQMIDRIFPEHPRSLLAIEVSYFTRIYVFRGKNVNFLVYEVTHISLRNFTACKLDPADGPFMSPGKTPLTDRV